MLFTMNTSVALRFTAFAALLLTAAPASAQFDDFAEDPLAAEGPEAEAAPPLPAAPAAAPAVAVNSAALADFARRNAVVAAALDLPRTNAAQKLRTVLTLVDLGRTDVAAAVLPELLAEQLDDAARAALVSEFGPAPFMKLIRLDARRVAEAEGDAVELRGDLAGAREFAQRCLDAAAALAHDPARLANIVQRLTNADEEARYAARVDLRATGPAGVVAALNSLAAATTAEQRTYLLEGLAELRPTVDEPLVAVLADGRGRMRADVAILAGRLKLHAALPWLAALSVSADQTAASAAHAALVAWGWPTPSPTEAQTLIRERIADLDAAPRLNDDSLRDPWWSWNQASGALVGHDLSLSQQRVLRRARLARALAEIGGAYPGDLREALIDSLESVALVGGELSAVELQRVAAMSAAEMSAALADAMQRDRFAAAAWLASEMASRGDLAVLSTGDGQPSPLAAALKSPVRSLRFAALKAVMKLAPTQTFPGASYVPKALWYFVAGAGQPAAVVAAPVFPKATDYAGQLRALGYDAMPAGAGRTALMAALDPARAPRLALVVIDSDISELTMREVVFQLRSSDRTALVPIVLASSVERLADAERLAAVHPLVIATPRPHGAAAVAEAVERARALAEHPMAGEETRTQQATQALDWIAALLAENAPYDELRREASLVNRALFVPELAPSAVRVLAALGTAESQTALADYASATTLPIEIRRQAAAGLAASFERYGIRLTSAQILRQYDRYNASEHADAETQALLGGILDRLEKR